jgi:ABC-type nitrate/sulfonate/bicarbonate transport system substrate-binding protein
LAALEASKLLAPLAMTFRTLAWILLSALSWGTSAAADMTPAPSSALVMQLDLSVKNVQFAGLLVAERAGYYRDAGLAVEIRRLGQDTGAYEGIAALVAASDHTVGSIESGLFLAGRAQGLPIVALGAMFQQTPLGLMSFRNRGIRTPADLAGKKVAVHGDGHEALDAVLQRAGMNRSQLTVTEAAYGNAPLLDGTYDAKQGYLVDELIQLQVEGHDVVALPFGAHGYAAYSQVYFVSEATLAKHRAALVKFIAANNRGWRDAATDIPGTAKFVVEKHEPQLELEYQTRSLSAIIPILTVESPQMGVTTPETWLKNAGAFLSSRPDAKLGEMSKWVDFSIAAEAAAPRIHAAALVVEDALVFTIEKHPLDQQGPQVIDLKVRLDYTPGIGPKEYPDFEEVYRKLIGWMKAYPDKTTYWEPFNGDLAKKLLEAYPAVASARLELHVHPTFGIQYPHTSIVTVKR